MDKSLDLSIQNTNKSIIISKSITKLETPPKNSFTDKIDVGNNVNSDILRKASHKREKEKFLSFVKNRLFSKSTTNHSPLQNKLEKDQHVGKNQQNQNFDFLKIFHYQYSDKYLKAKQNIEERKKEKIDESIKNCRASLFQVLIKLNEAVKIRTIEKEKSNLNKKLFTSQILFMLRKQSKIIINFF